MRQTPIALLLMGLFLSPFAGPVASAQSLPLPPLTTGPITVSGLSSGAFMAGQYHIAHSSEVEGTALLAGGLYGCAVDSLDGTAARGDILRALNQCLANNPTPEPAARFTAMIDTLAKGGAIDDPSHLQGDSIYLFSGRADTTVGRETLVRSAEVLDHYGARTTLLTALPAPMGDTQRASHAFLTEATGQPCGSNDAPYVTACGYDQAGALLARVLDETLTPPAPTLPGTVQPFDQAPFIPDGKTPEAISMGPRGFLYVPRACAEGSATPCRLHVAFHGCKQSDDTLAEGSKFHELTGYNRWAETNRIVVLYPQATASQGNPMGCWNWWGYAGDGHFLDASGDQMRAIKAMVDALQGL